MTSLLKCPHRALAQAAGASLLLSLGIHLFTSKLVTTGRLRTEYVSSVGLESGRAWLGYSFWYSLGVTAVVAAIICFLHERRLTREVASVVAWNSLLSGALFAGLLYARWLAERLNFGARGVLPELTFVCIVGVPIVWAILSSRRGLHN